MSDAQTKPTQAQLLSAYTVICDKLNCTNYVDVLADALVENQLMFREDNSLMPLEEAKEYFRKASARDPLHFVVILVGDLAQALRESGCEFKSRPFKWEG